MFGINEITYFVNKIKHDCQGFDNELALVYHFRFESASKNEWFCLMIYSFLFMTISTYHTKYTGAYHQLRLLSKNS